MKKYKLSNNIEIRYIDLLTEMGELGKELIKGTQYGKSSYSNTSAIAEEIGDCLFSFFALCNAIDINAAEELENALLKYTSRFEKKGDIGLGK